MSKQKNRMNELAIEPYHPKTIKLRLNPDGIGEAHFRFSEYGLTVLCDGEEVRCDLGRAEFRLLYLLVSEPGRIFTKSELIEFSWESRVVSDGSLTQAIYNLRSYFWRCGKDVFITTPRIGYYFNASYLAIANDTKDLVTGSERAATGRGSHLVVEASPLVKSQLTRNLFLSITASVILFLLWTYSRAISDEHIDDITKQAGNVRVHIVWNKNSTLDAERKHLSEQIDKMSYDFDGEVWLTFTKDRYRITCFANNVAETYASPMENMLSKVITKCFNG